MAKKRGHDVNILGIALIALGALLFLTSCGEPGPDDLIQQPGKPNVVQYASKMEIDQWRHKVANSIIKHGVPGYSIVDDIHVEVLVEFREGTEPGYTGVVAQRYQGAYVEKSDKGHLIMLPQVRFWDFVKDPHVKRVGVAKVPDNLLATMKR